MRRLLAPTSAVLVALLLAACGVPVDDAPRALPSTAVAATTAAAVPGSAASAVVWLVRDDRITPRRTPVPPPGDPEAALRALLERLPAAPGRARSAIPAGTRLLSVVTESGVATLDLSPEFAATGGDELRLAVAQVVFTATEPGGGITGVRLRIEGEPVDVPLRDASLSDEPLSRAEYADLVRRSEG